MLKLFFSIENERSIKRNLNVMIGDKLSIPFRGEKRGEMDALSHNLDIACHPPDIICQALQIPGLAQN
jgi:hypothetical protein